MHYGRVLHLIRVWNSSLHTISNWSWTCSFIGRLLRVREVSHLHAHEISIAWVWVGAINSWVNLTVREDNNRLSPILLLLLFRLLRFLLPLFLNVLVQEVDADKDAASAEHYAYDRCRLSVAADIVTPIAIAVTGTAT